MRIASSSYAQRPPPNAQTIESLLPFVRAGTAALLTDGTSCLLLEDAPPSLAAKLPTLFSSSAALLLLEGPRLRIAEPRHISLLDPEIVIEGSGSLDPDALATLMGNLPPPSAWSVTVDGALEAVLGGGSSAGSAAAAEEVEDEEDGVDVEVEEEGGGDGGDGGLMADVTMAARAEAAQALLNAANTLTPRIVQLQEPEPSAALLKQSARVGWVRDQLEVLPLHSSPKRDDVLSAYAQRIEMQRKQSKQSRRGGGRSGGSGSELSSDDGGLQGGTWQQFEAVGAVLRQFGAINDDWVATEFGELVAELAGDNELWLALVMLELADKSDLQPQQLAAILGATLDERVRPNAYVGYFSSERVLEVLDELDERAEALSYAQFEQGLSFPATIELSAVPLVEAWAAGEEWGALLANTSLDGGDIFRILRRTIELLRSVASVPYVSPQVTNVAKDALRAMNRYPLADNVLMGVQQQQPEAEEAA